MRGSVSKYTDELGDEICKITATSTVGLRHICEQLGLPYSTVSGWVYDKEHPLSGKYARAKQMQIEHMAEEILAIADDSTNDTISTEKGDIPDNEWINRSRLRVDTRKWLMSKLAPKKYGDKLDVTSDGEKVNQVFVIGGQEVKF